MAGPKTTSGAAIERGQIKLPEREIDPVRQITRRVLYGLGILAAVVCVVMADGTGYKDSSDGQMSWLDALYYATVTLSTTGYGDIVPVSPTARLVNVLVITPLRIAFLAILVGTAFQVLTKNYRDQVRRDRWRKTLRGHTVVIGYGTKGANAIKQLHASGTSPEQVVVVDNRQEYVDEANRDGYAAVLGDATRAIVLRQASVHTAARVIIATNRDDTAVLATLTVRQLNPKCLVAVAIREAENEPLLLRSGADAVITSSAAAGRLLGVAAKSPQLSEVFSDLLVHGDGLELVERPVQPEEVGRTPREYPEPVVAVLRDGKALPWQEVTTLQSGDCLVVVGCRPRKRNGEVTSVIGTP
ncbi:NAD-binding protein of Kef-type K+ transporter [Catellatospora methionotrophica]|uniref:NAD-binding protein of Kef-type K+ transporter n=1 Tax=Catellatospora methionotrophica TaxID=121620 RepID=A0A8J3PH01_9ACTN|nr:potassium channel family protein [Catellatospora methionotrophica]GIG16219.1 NAD-binding protein of Kef-type K+ transporter [Catellatospora methionotrophica]